MAWSVKADYVETCSCELMCPCNLSLDHGATYDFCRVTLVFDIREGEIEGTDPMVGEMLGVERVPIEVVHDGLRHSVRIGDGVDFEIEDIVPFGVETGEPIRFQGMFHPVGTDLTMAQAKRSQINGFGISYKGKTGLSKAGFSWAA